MTTVDMNHLQAWVGREQQSTDPLTPFPARALAAALDHGRLPNMGDPLPPSWHWLYFLDSPSTAGTGVDGHPHKGGFLPPVPLSRRMWAAGSIDVRRPLRLGKTAERRSTIRSIEYKSGKSGELVFVTVDHRVHQQSELCIREEQTLVYRAKPAERTPLPHGEEAPTAADWSRVFEPDPVLLFRYSALTYNSHRIHYDRKYAVHEELYPALVVHAPLLVTLLLDLVLQQYVGLPVMGIRFRALRPTFDSAPVRLAARRTDRRVALWSADSENYVGLSATAELGEPS
jgi:3-methylfumaryl-CoA hydratase